ncbi:MAG: hypothetical protein BMS9Abin11_0974 [Gammaproteobacteria bacterium]|nr:MAG: hypothetical protein BMS9Abin11_0974 [Gammaproteobacteria bacterium]
MHFGAGYWVYFAHEDSTVILLLCSGDKNSQVEDIATAKHFWKKGWFMFYSLSMPRPLRIEYENAYYHVMNRGAGRKPLF